MMKQIYEISMILQFSGTVLAILFNTILIFIVYFTKHESIGRYKYMIMAFALFEAIFATDVLVLMPIGFVGERTWIIFNIAGPFFQTPYAVISTILYCYFYYNWMIFVMAHFIYRYIILCRPKVAAQIAVSSRLKLMIGSIWFLGSSYVAVCAGILCTGNTVTESVRRKMQSIYGSEHSFDSGYSLLRLTKLDGTPSFIGILATINHYCVIPGTLAVIVFCSVRIFTKIRLLDKMHILGLRTHKELFLALAIQTSIPVVLCHAPGIIYLSFPFLEEGVNLGPFSTLFTVLTTVPKVVDPLITMTCIQQYRSVITSRFKTIKQPVVIRLRQLSLSHTAGGSSH